MRTGVARGVRACRVGATANWALSRGAHEMTPLTMDRLRDAREMIARSLAPTPLLPAGDDLWLKCECLQPTGSFKIRGATYFLSKLTTLQRARGVVAYSTGNHAQAVAKAAFDLGVAATIVMSPDVPKSKLEATLSWGARVEMAEPASQARRLRAEAIAGDSGAILVPPYDDLDIMAGQATIIFELRQQLGDLKDTDIFVPIGGGGLIGGVATAVKCLEPTARVIGVEPEWEADAYQSFREGRIVSLPGPSGSIADAIKVQALGELTFPLIQFYVDEIITVSEDEIRTCVLDLVDRHKLVVEPGGAVGFAAARREMKARRSVALLCGGNIDRDRLDALRIQGTH